MCEDRATALVSPAASIATSLSWTRCYCCNATAVMKKERKGAKKKRRKLAPFDIIGIKNHAENHISSRSQTRSYLIIIIMQ